MIQISNGNALLPNSANTVSKRAELNHLTLNAKKCYSIIFGTHHTIKLFQELNISHISINENGDLVPFVTEITSLGVILDNTFSWKPQIQRVTKKVNKALYGLKFIRQCTTQQLGRRMVESLVVPDLDYCNVVYLDASLYCRLQLQRLSNACIRYIFGLRKETSISTYRKKLNWLRVDSRRDYFALLLIYKVVRMKEPPILTSLFIPFNSDRPIRGLRKDLDIAAVHTLGD